MKKGLCLLSFLVLAAQLPLWGYDTSPSQIQVVPEVIWAAATGGGTWVTELQITYFGPTEGACLVWFEYAGGTSEAVPLFSGLVQYHSVRYSNILSELQTLNPSFTYYGRVGALWIQAGAPDRPIQAQARIVNGNYGKTLPGVNILEGTTGSTGRPLIIQDLVQNATYRMFVGLFNASTANMSITLTIIDADNQMVGTPFVKTLMAFDFISFNPFRQAGILSGDYSNCWLYIEATAGGDQEPGLICYGSVGNNYTNDTYTIMAKQYGGSAIISAPKIRD